MEMTRSNALCAAEGAAMTRRPSRGSVQVRLFAPTAALSGPSPPISWEFPANGQATHTKVLNTADNSP